MVLGMNYHKKGLQLYKDTEAEPFKFCRSAEAEDGDNQGIGRRYIVKVARHENIELIHQYDIDTQEELASRLNEGRVQGHTGNGVKRYSCS